MKGRISLFIFFTILFIKINAFADTIIEPLETHTQTFDQLTAGTYKVECKIENPNYQERIVDIEVTTNGYINWKTFLSLNQRFTIYNQDFIRVDNELILTFKNFDDKYYAKIIYCNAIHTFN